MSELLPDALLQGGKYRIEKTLGQGGFGITYLAEQTNLGRKVCIKEFFMKEYGERTTAKSSDEDETVLTAVSPVTSAAGEIMGRYREKFVKEARTIARLDHPGIVRIHDVFEENGTAYYVMDFIEGENLNDLVKREGALSEERALGYIRQVADALSFVHDHRIMHLDVKPANIIVRKSDDKAILIDFGTAKQYDSEGTQTSTTPVGLSVGYAPIEMTKPGGVQTFSPETDVYSLGATLYYLVTGQNPPDASERIEMIMEGETLQYPGNISQTVITAIEQALQSRKKRPQTVAAFLELLPTIKPENTEKKRLEFCPECGEKLLLTAKFCPNCGMRLSPSISDHCSDSPSVTAETPFVPKASQSSITSGLCELVTKDICENIPKSQSASTKKPVSVLGYNFIQDNSSTIRICLKFDVDTCQFSEKESIVGVLYILSGEPDPEDEELSSEEPLYVIYADYADLASNTFIEWPINFLEFDEGFFEKGKLNYLYLYLYRSNAFLDPERMSAEEIVDNLSGDKKFYTIGFDIHYKPHLFKDDEFLFDDGVNAYAEDEK